MLIHREADHFPRMTVGHGETACGIAEMLEAFLPIERNRIMDLGLDAVVEAILIERIALLGEHHVEMVDVPHIGAARRHA